MKKNHIVLALLLTALLLTAGCGTSTTKTSAPAESGQASASAAVTTAPQSAAALADGVYSADFTTDSSMFHVNEANNGKGVLTVKDGKMTIHVSLASVNIVKLFVGTAADAQKDGATLLDPTTDTVTYSDGSTEQVCGFDIPVPAIGEEYNLALLGKKGTWYDHKVSVTNPVAKTN